jgi:hypothetical protein
MSPEAGGTAAVPGGPTRMDAFKAQVRKAVVVFIVADLVFIGLALLLYFQVFAPRLDRMAAERDQAVRTGVALQARARAVEARYALTVMDLPAARMAAGDVRAQLLGLAGRIPEDRATEVAEVKQLVERAALIESALDVDPHAARKDLEVLEAKLAALYPPPSFAPERR